ncbi:hypothetical protein CI102_8306 [Trichoderma harzianum]|uniref:Uncharacterized protein n=1 Tax=Trichoderma harzianum CBS 226.95 TaxID=983964 RepID=A0A2T4ARP3_TRIHA|nr:hypothetical protein M431DRAFT_504679 [Trichoderma harzianum CBS 226.95]PKK47412.1 hypothetical protein CI102_8306 [Trichoderma harzianum]PTB59713.1 hypothetical protein M431DRAFT_504679 [Trichoderma harzianum CBS 226.95]
MQQLSQLVAFSMLAASALASPLQPRAPAADCYINKNTAWWIPTGAPTTPPTVTLQTICKQGGVGGCQQNLGRFCVLGDLDYCESLEETLDYYQKYVNNSHWEFPSVIQCGNLALSVAAT